MRAWRTEALERLAGRNVDLVVVGAGVIGARVAYDAARAGLRVALVDAGDVAGATSSASSKLLHGGFRYLAMGSYGLVHAAQAESRVLATRVAPHLSRPLPVVLAMDRGRWPEWRLNCGLMLYFGLAGFRPPRPRLLDADEALSIAPELLSASERIHILLPEFQTDDSRLVLATATGACARRRDRRALRRGGRARGCQRTGREHRAPRPPERRDPPRADEERRECERSLDRQRTRAREPGLRSHRTVEQGSPRDAAAAAGLAGARRVLLDGRPHELRGAVAGHAVGGDHRHRVRGRSGSRDRRDRGRRRRSRRCRAAPSCRMGEPLARPRDLGRPPRPSALGRRHRLHAARARPGGWTAWDGLDRRREADHAPASGRRGDRTPPGRRTPSPPRHDRRAAPGISSPRRRQRARVARRRGRRTPPAIGLRVGGGAAPGVRGPGGRVRADSPRGA